VLLSPSVDYAIVGNSDQDPPQIVPVIELRELPPFGASEESSEHFLGDIVATLHTHAELP